MTNDTRDREETNSIRSSTKLISDAIHRFKRPSRKGQHDTQIESVRFMLPQAQTVDVPGGTVLVMGRKVDAESEVNFDLSVLYDGDSGVSRTHAIVQITYDAVFVRDYNSRNGTYLNGEQLYPMRDYAINDGDELRLGQVSMRVIFA